MESPIYTPSPIRSQTRLMSEMTRLRMEYEKNLSQLYAAQAEYKAAYQAIRLLIECGAPNDLDIKVVYGVNSLVYFADESECAITGGIMDALLRSGMDYRIDNETAGEFVYIHLRGYEHLILMAKNESIVFPEEAIQCAA